MSSNSIGPDSQMPDHDRRPRLLIWTDCGAPGGIYEFNHSIAISMAARGYKTTVVGPQFDPVTLQDEQLRGIEHHEVMLPELSIQGPAILSEFATSELIRKISPDVVLFSDGSAISNLLAKGVAASIGLPMIFSVGIVLGQHVQIARAKAEFPRIYQVAHRVVCVSRHNLKMLSEQYPVGTVQPTLIHYGRPEKFFKPRDDDRRAAIRSELGISSDEILFLTSARYEAIKGFGLFTLALKALHADPIWSKLKFAWAGDGSARSKIAELLSTEGINDRVLMLGPRNDIDALLDAADVFVLPSYAEGMPLAIMEAMAKGLPVIASKVSGIPEELGDTGILIDDPSVSSAGAGTGLVKAIYELATKPERRLDLGKRAKIRANLLFQESRMITDYERLIADICPTSKIKPHDYVSAGMENVSLDAAFPNMIRGNTGESDWPFLRRNVFHHWYVDRRHPFVGFLSRDEAHIVFNAARLFAGKAALEIGCFMGWSTCHLAAGGVRLDVVDPLLGNALVRNSVESSLRAAGLSDRVNLVTGQSPGTVRSLAADGRRWSLIFIDGDHEGDAPRLDAATAEQFAAADCVVLFHDLAAPAVANAVRYFRDRGWKIRIYGTMQIMAAAWRGQIEPPPHMPDQTVDWTLPLHLADLGSDETFWSIHQRAKPHTMTSMERQFALHKAVNFVVDRGIPGDIVECGVWRGGSMMVAALTLIARGVTDRRLTLYDTFAGMTPPTIEDVEAHSGKSAQVLLASMTKTTENVYWALAPLDQVKANLATTGYPRERIDYVMGDVCKTLPLRAAEQIALLRLDTDWYASTRCELESLYAQLMPGGVLIIDDYGHWEGARRACDEFFARHGGTLRPIPDDYTGYWLVKGSDELSEEFMQTLRIR